MAALNRQDIVIAAACGLHRIRRCSRNGRAQMSGAANYRVISTELLTVLLGSTFRYHIYKPPTQDDICVSDRTAWSNPFIRAMSAARRLQ